MKNYRSEKTDKLQAVHVSKTVHKKFKSFCIEKDLRVGETAEKALLQFIKQPVTK